MNIEELKGVHKLLRRYKWWYYEGNKSLVSDYDYDMLEKKYTKACDELGIEAINRVDTYVDFSINIPLSW